MIFSFTFVFLDSKCMDLSNLSDDDPNFIEGKRGNKY